MSASKTQRPASVVRQYSLKTIADIYDTMTPDPIPLQTQTVFREIRKDLQSVLKHTEQRNKRQERRRHQNSSRTSTSNGRSGGGNYGSGNSNYGSGSGGGNYGSSNSSSNSNSNSNSSGGHLIISRSFSTPVDAFKTFQKKYNLILNSLIDSNAGEVCQRLSKLFLQQKAVTSTAKGALDEKAEQYAAHVCQQLMDNASIQAIYSQAYVILYKTFLQRVFDDGYKILHTFIKDRLIQIVLQTEPASVTRLSSKGLAKFVTYLYLNNQMTGHDFNAFLKTWMDSITTNEAIICEVFVHAFLTLAEQASSKAKWSPYVKSTIQLLWEDDSTVGMRSRIRLWDIRDAYA